MRPPRGGGFRGRGRGSPRGGFRGGGRGGFRGGYRDEGPPAVVVEVGEFHHECEGEAVCKLTLKEKVPYFNGPVYLENKTAVGKVEEIFGPIHSAMFTVKMAEGVQASSYAAGDKFYVSSEKLLPLARFLPGAKPAGRGGRGGGRGGRGGFGGRGRGSPRGSFGRGRGGGRGGGFRGGRGRY